MIKKELLKPSDIEGQYDISLEIEGQNIEISLTPDDKTLDDTLILANNVLKKFKTYEKQARNLLVKEYLSAYNDNWREEEAPKLTKTQFSERLTLTSISFLADSHISFYYDDNEMFEGHSLIAQSSDGKTFDATTMFG